MITEAKPPQKWPDTPNWMSFSLLKQIETCPRRWALSNAIYPDIWSQKGYPRRVSIKAVTGTIIHRVLKVVVESLLLSKCQTFADPKSVLAMKQLGGFTGLIESEIVSIVKALQENPREKDYVSLISRQLHSKVADIRFQVQTLLKAIVLSDSLPMSSRLPNDHGKSNKLPMGQHAEVPLQVVSLKWKGVIDLISISERGCEITDYKTGEVDEGHSLQLQIYSLLWYLCAELNPSKQIADKLTVLYVTGKKQIQALSQAELAQLESDISIRTQRALAECNRQPPRAVPKKAECCYCHVRHLCREYWTHDVQKEFKKEVKGDDLSIDLELRISKIHGPRSYNASCLLSSDQRVKDQVLLQVQEGGMFSEGERVRILNATVGPDDEEDKGVTIVNLSNWGEAYRISN